MATAMHGAKVVKVEDPPNEVAIYRSGNACAPPEAERSQQLVELGLPSQAKRVQQEANLDFATKFYCELQGRELRVWQNFLPTIYYDPSIYRYDTIPEPALEEITTAMALKVFDQIQIWSPEVPERPPRLDPMAVGMIFLNPYRWFAITRWAESLISTEKAEEIVRNLHGLRKKHCGERMIRDPGSWIKICLACGHMS